MITLGNMVKSVARQQPALERIFDFNADRTSLSCPHAVEEFLSSIMERSYRPDLPDEKQIDEMIRELDRTKTVFDQAIRSLYRLRLNYSAEDRERLKQEKHDHKSAKKKRLKEAKRA